MPKRAPFEFDLRTQATIYRCGCTCYEQPVPRIVQHNEKGPVFYQLGLSIAWQPTDAPALALDKPEVHRHTADMIVTTLRTNCPAPQVTVETEGEHVVIHLYGINYKLPRPAAESLLESLTRALA